MTAGMPQSSGALAGRRLADELLEQGFHGALAPPGAEDEHARTAA